MTVLPDRSSTLRGDFLLDPSIVHLNHGGFGAVPRQVFEVYQRWQAELERHPSALLSHRYDEAMGRVRASVAGLLGCSASDVAMVHNTTAALNAVARSLQLRPGDEILSTDHEYEAMDILWENVCRESGARYIRQPLPVPMDDEAAVVERLFEAVTSSTRALFVSHITSVTAIRLPVEAICRRARALGILTIVDGAHAVGQVEVDLGALGVDIYAASCHKWMCAPRGTGFLYVEPRYQDLVAAPLTSHGSRPGCSFLERFRWQGTGDPCGLLSLPEAIKFIQQPRWDVERRRGHELARAARSAVADAFGFEQLTPDADKWYAQMVALPVPRCDDQLMRRRLLEQHRVDAPVRSWNGRSLVRASFQAYNTTDDVERLVDALSEMFSTT